jgi:hypothetical protein
MAEKKKWWHPLAATAIASALTLGLSSGVVAPASAVVSLTGEQKFVSAVYTDFLGRLPSSAELARDSATVSQFSGKLPLTTKLTSSTEWLTTIVTKMYVDTLSRQPDAQGLAAWVTWLQQGRFTVAQVASQFYSSPEYYLYHAGGTDTAWVTKLYTTLLQRQPDANGLTMWVGLAGNSWIGRTYVAGKLYETLESAMFRVQAIYQKMLGRDPDPSGWYAWSVSVGEKGDLAMAANIANSDEYWNRAQNRF